MRLVVVGSSGSFAGPESPASSYLVQVPDGVSPDGREWNLLLDMGNGALGALQRVVDPRRLDAIGLSHLHPDHFVDVCGLYVYLKYHPDRAADPARGPDHPAAHAAHGVLPVWGPSGTADRIGATYGLEAGESMDSQFDFRTWQPGQVVTVGPLEIEPYRVYHPVEAYGMRVTGPSSLVPGERVTLAYTGDTDACDGVVDLARDADLLLAEAAFQEGRDDAVDRGIHLTGKRAGEVATAAGARRLVLTHLPAWNDRQAARDEATAVYAGPVDLAATGRVFTL
ncbi:MBL fold metallo-hydrolase [Oerskovia sp. Sa1BUA8]|uniref:MBL fold metallo-hydrolase n=1 Tax=Oerskovia douganii TaxID=2762210 RepID=A0A9D5U7L6_9CELL|nr:MBL fold metallo-hydrolase [Oerskovia douganii]MBE7699993.1 MBL fold metallo-hydrolase [Oerskovia douganii]